MRPLKASAEIRLIEVDWPGIVIVRFFPSLPPACFPLAALVWFPLPGAPDGEGRGQGREGEGWSGKEWTGRGGEGKVREGMV